MNEPNLPPNWGKTKYDKMTDEEFEAANPFGPPPPHGTPTDFSGLTEADFAEMAEQSDV